MGERRKDALRVTTKGALIKSEGDIMTRTLIQKNTSNIMKILIEKAMGISDIHHKGIKGRLRELFNY